MKVRTKLWTWVLAIVATLGIVLGLNTVAYAAVNDTPDHDKTLTVNDDGTYTIALNVKGESEKQPNNVNIIVIVDRSNSMNESSGTGAYVPSTQNGTNMYGLVDGAYVPLTRVDHGWGANPRYTYNVTSTGEAYTGQRYQYDATATRIEATKAAVDGLASALLGYNGKDGNPDDTVEMALVDFATAARTLVANTTDPTTFTNAVNGINPPGGNAGGTNWEMALRQADTINFGDSDPTYVIFFSDGAPTFYGTGPSGTGGEQEPNMANSYNASTDEAAALAQKVGVDRFYTIFAYGSNAGRTYMTNLTTAAGAPAGNNYSASNTAELNDAFAAILESIEMAGIGNVGITDGTTSNVTTSSGEVSHLLTVDESSYKYYRAGGTADGGGEKYDSTANGGLGEEWADAPKATFENGAVKWNIDGVLENDVTYTVTFDCWPSQTTLDIVADIKNDPSSYDDLDENIKQYIDRNGDLKTNTTASIAWTDNRPGGTGHSDTYVNPDPVTTTAVEELAISKEWENELDGQSAAPITLTVTSDGKDHHTLTLSADNSWTASTFISIGIMRTSGSEVEVLETGHDFTFTEPADLGYYWELEVPTIRPMLVDGTLTMLILKGDAPYDNPDGATEYTIDGKTYYAGETGAAALTATNHRRARLNLTKVVTGEDADPEQTFPFTLNVIDSKASEGSADDLNSDYYVWFSIYNGGFVDGVVSGAEKEIGEDGAWTGYYYAPSGSNIVVNLKAGDNLRFLNLPTGSTYTFTEGTLPANYAFVSSELTTGTDSTFDGDQTTTGTIEATNTDYTVKYTNQYDLTDIEITKVWVDNGDQDGMRPTADEFAEYLVLKADGTDVTAANASKLTVVDNDDDTFTATWAGLDRFADGEEIAYTVEETEIDGYTTTGSPAADHGTITNTHEPELIDIDVVKKWIGPEGDEITVTLFADGEATENTATLNANNKWAGSFIDLPKFKDGTEIDYTVEEAGVSGVDASKYTTTIAGDAENGFVITNTNTETVDIEVTKAWADASNQDGIRPESLTLTLNGAPEGTTVPDPAITKSGDNWTYKWTGLPKYDKTTGEELEYTVTEGTVPEGYTCETTTVAAGGTITNVHTPDETTVKVTKAWDDANNQDGKRPESVSVQLKAGGENYGEAVTLNAAGNWTYTWENLPVNKAGEAIKYTVEETPVPTGYTAAVTGDAATGFTVTNSYTPEVTTATVTKVWDDNDDQDGKRPTELEVTLLADGKATETTETLSADNNWTATVTGLPKFSDGTEIKYTWSEGTIREYELVSNVTEGTSTTITNKHEIEKTQFTVTKIWEDADNQDGARPASVVIELLADGTKVNEVTLNEQNEWTHTFTNLDKYAEGEEIVYTATESNAPTSYTATVEAVEGGAEITNTHTPSTIDINGTKTWDDADNQDGKRPETITVNLLADGVKVDSKTVSAPWTYSFKGVPEFAAGKKIVYTVAEETVAEYDGTITGYDIKNTHLPEKINIEVEKKWEDADNQDGKRPEQIIINLLADGEVIDSATVTAAEDGTWTHSWTGLDKYAAGEEIEYTVTEEPVDEYTTEIDGYLVINTHELEKTTVTVSKTWNDAENQDGKRPGSITINLFGDGEAVKSASVTPDADGKWTYTFENLPKYAEGKQGVEIVYTITEDKVDEYETTIDGFDVTNTHAPEKTEVSVTKVWDDADNQDGKRPGSVTVNLLADGEATGKTLTLSGENSWTGTFTELDKYKAGKEIAYSVTEDEVAEYETAITGSAANGFTVTNTHEPELIDVPVTKVWEDADDQDGKRADVVTVALLADGEDAGKTVELSEDNSWTATFTDLPKYKAGEEIDYSVRENEVAGYEVAIEGTVVDGYTVTNTHEPEKTEVKVTKVWDDANDKDGIRPAEITVTLLANGTEAGTATLNEGNSWTYTWTELDKYAAGEEIAYTVSEEQVKDYDEPAISGDAKDGFTITNFHKAQPDSVFVDPPVQKVVQGSPKTAGTFTFQLKAVTKDAPMPAESGNGIKTIQITGAGSKEFGKIEYTKPGEYVYEITELKGSDDGYTYDTTVYTLTVKVEEVADGTQFKLVKTETVTGGNGSIVFTNVYQPPIPKAGDVTPMISQIAGIAAAGSALIAAGVVRRRRED